MTPRVQSPVPGVRYEIAVHGEPPEGVEVLWHNDRSGMRMWSGWRAKSDTHWMRAPVDAPQVQPPASPSVPEAKEPRGDDPFSWVCRDWCNPVPEEPPFPLSREEFEAWFSGRKFIEGGPFWLWFRNASTPTYEDAVTAWRAAGCPGATPAAEEGAAQEGPWTVFCAILGEEFGEVCQAVLQQKPVHDVREELIQTAAVAVQWVEILDRRVASPSEGRG